MDRTWVQRLGTLATGLVVLAASSGCASRPAPRPGPSAVNPGGATQQDINASLANSASTVSGVAPVEAVRVGNVALLAVDISTNRPGGSVGSVTGNTDKPDYPGTSAGRGPATLRGPGVGTGTTPASPGGAYSSGTSSPGGLPTSTQAVPDAYGSPAGFNTGMGHSTPAPGGIGTAPMDVLTRIANRIRSDHRDIAEVRFVMNDQDVARLKQIAQAIRQGQPTANFGGELNAMAQRAVPAGTYDMRGGTPPLGSPATIPNR